jgi:glycosyltransferase involved in cell wall biosynthesis
VNVAIAHDYLTQRGGAERVVLSMMEAFPAAAVHTTLFDPCGTFPEFDPGRVLPTAVNRFGLLRHNHRLALPLLAPVVSHMQIDADVVLCSSSGWAHGVVTPGAKVVYCHAPARWLYQRREYLRGFGVGPRLIADLLREPLVRWDQRAARTASCYLANSSYVAGMVKDLYGFDAEVLPPPPALTPEGARQAVRGLEPGFVLCVSRLLSYKNIDVVVDAFSRLPGEHLVIVGDGPDRKLLRQRASANVRFLGTVDDATLRWLYDNSSALVAAAREDYGLTPLEAASFGKPTAALRFGGFVDTLVEGRTGVFFDEPEPKAVATAVDAVLEQRWDPRTLEAHAARFSHERFAEQLRAIVAETASGASR